jgi:hypothetical protein
MYRVLRYNLGKYNFFRPYKILRSYLECALRALVKWPLSRVRGRGEGKWLKGGFPANVIAHGGLRELDAVSLPTALDVAPWRLSGGSILTRLMGPSDMGKRFIFLLWILFFGHVGFTTAHYGDNCVNVGSDS